MLVGELHVVTRQALLRKSGAQAVHVKFIIGLLNNTLPAEHETSKSLVGLWSGNRARRAQCVPRDVTWHRLNADSCKELVDIPPLIAVWYQAW